MTSSQSNASQTNISEALQWGLQELSSNSDSAQLDAEVCLQHCLNKNRAFLYTWPEKPLKLAQWQQFSKMILRRKKGEPIAHITGEREFWSLPFLVNNTTLIPRPDTEILVETALNLDLPDNARVLDLGTGTGAIALSLAHEESNWQITAVDKMPEAVELAILNKAHLSLSNVSILQSDWFTNIAKQKFDLIISNPPYIDETDHHLNEGDVRFEPSSALTARESGYADLYYIAEQAKHFLTDGGYLLLEHGYEQTAQLKTKFENLQYSKIQTIKDYGNNDRCTLGVLGISGSKGLAI
ncbi:peptide chain release factor N(5)-glutamine methyltransferase [Parashewanella spongiae]|uniref:Release factor glutamine methyltransferase n=1 Tax=Parashewanella spongiae TaxID=342950 RepID=A0A3A6U5Z9_9GAMM|nr:peptide chain release factor N(5)-glutamine methyltransferase [Parashewanella spongiae]MCL1078347.1 peptide chain release factor N(5)-glutamine methyltransferase [Parashewanella spongiae]RJY16894.1 peptide chain release factor N(5)-glutamine methyltransferase [Parashewanella spongiae]